MIDTYKQEFSRFAKERLHPAATAIAAHKRTGLIRGLLVGGGLFLIGVGVIYNFLSPYRQMMQDHNFSLWPLFILAPMAVGILAFSLIFILGLRRTVVNFRRALAAGLSEFIDPSFVVASDAPLARDVFDASHLFAEGQKVHAGIDAFHGRVGDAAVRLADIAVTEGKGKAGSRRGVFIYARYDRSFPYPFFIFPGDVDVSRSGLEKSLADDGVSVAEGLVRIQQKRRQVLLPANQTTGVNALLPRELVQGIDGLRVVNGSEWFMSVRGESLYLVFLGPNNPSGDATSILENFDFDACREFTRDAKIGLAIVASYGGRLGELGGGEKEGTAEVTES